MFILAEAFYQDLSQTSSQIKHLQSPTPQEIPTHHISVEQEVPWASCLKIIWLILSIIKSLKIWAKA